MKRTLLMLGMAASLNGFGQNINPEVDNLPESMPQPTKQKTCDSLFTGWAIDVNLTGGALTQNLTTVNPAAGYQNAINPNISGIKFSNGMTYGIDGEVDRFFGKRHHFGVGVGVYYAYQTGNVTMNNFNIQYQSQDNFGSVFRQEITADQPIKETLNISNFNIPILFKYQTRFSDRWGFTADAGLLVNLVETNSYSTNASFDYEAIYKYVPNDNGGTTAVYDNSPTPGSSDVLITKAQYLGTHTEAQLQSYFNQLKGEGYNVGLGITPNSNTGHVSYTAGTVGVLLRPAISYYLSQNVALNLGVFYVYQDFNNSSSSYQLTNKIGSYNSMLNGVTSSVNNSYGVSIGLRFLFNRKKQEVLPDEIPVAEQPEVAPAPTPAPPPPAEDTTEPEEAVDVSTPILFDLNRTVIKSSSYPVLEEAAKEIHEDPDSYIEINGYTDATGTAIYNLGLSRKRAAVVKSYLRKQGVDPKAMKTIGHGAKSPAASNKTREGRAQNRRVVMKIKKKPVKAAK